jgi:hypothetical protein
LEVRNVLKGSRSTRAFAKRRHCCLGYSSCFVYA